AAPGTLTATLEHLAGSAFVGDVNVLVARGKDRQRGLGLGPAAPHGDDQLYVGQVFEAHADAAGRKDYPAVAVEVVTKGLSHGLFPRQDFDVLLGEPSASCHLLRGADAVQDDAGGADQVDQLFDLRLHGDGAHRLFAEVVR